MDGKIFRNPSGSHLLVVLLVVLLGVLLGVLLWFGAEVFLFVRTVTFCVLQVLSALDNDFRKISKYCDH